MLVALNVLIGYQFDILLDFCYYTSTYKLSIYFQVCIILLFLNITAWLTFSERKLARSTGCMIHLHIPRYMWITLLLSVSNHIWETTVTDSGKLEIISMSSYIFLVFKTVHYDGLDLSKYPVNGADSYHNEITGVIWRCLVMCSFFLKYM